MKTSKYGAMCAFLFNVKTYDYVICNLEMFYICAIVN